MSLTFRIYRGTQLLREETLAQPVIKIGKVSSAHHRLEDESVSRMHAIVEVAGGTVSLIDLGSTRGTFVNGQRINKATLQSGDAITVGDLRIEVTMSLPQLAVVPPPLPPPVPVPVPVPVAALAELAKASPPTPPAMVNIATEATIAFRLGIMMSSFCSVELADRDRCDT